MIRDDLSVGAIVPYAGPTDNPNDPHGADSYPAYGSKAYSLYLEQHGWLVCDGRAVPVAKYPELFRAIGFIHGRAGPGLFMLPDCRGRVLRGVTLDARGPDNLLRDPQAAQRAAAGAGGWSGNQVGSVQDDAFQTHEHLYQKAIQGGASGPGSPVFGQYMIPETQTEGAVMPTGCTPPVSIRQSPETRVKNVYVNFLIKYRRGARVVGPLRGSGLDGFGF